MNSFILIILLSIGLSQAQRACGPNQILNGQQCVCAPGYFSGASEVQKERCEDECEEVYYSLFTHGTCTGGIFGRLNENQQPACNMRCGMRLRLWTTIFIFVTFAAAVATLFFTLPTCIATCGACLQAKKANKRVKKTQQVGYADGHAAAGAAPSGMEVKQYNPYAYWPYYGRV